jgi:hypothetical protein
VPAFCTVVATAARRVAAYRSNWDSLRRGGFEAAGVQATMSPRAPTDVRPAVASAGRRTDWGGWTDRGVAADRVASAWRTLDSLAVGGWVQADDGPVCATSSPVLNEHRIGALESVLAPAWWLWAVVTGRRVPAGMRRLRLRCGASSEGSWRTRRSAGEASAPPEGKLRSTTIPSKQTSWTGMAWRCFDGPGSEQQVFITMRCQQ